MSPEREILLTNWATAAVLCLVFLLLCAAVA